MKAKKRVVTAGGRTTARRTPTVRRIKSAIVPVSRAAAPPTRRPPPPTSAEGMAGQRRESQAVAELDLAVDLGRGLVLANPILAAAGTFGYGIEHGDPVDVARLGAIVTRGTTLRPRSGNAGRRMVETPGGLLNAVGLQNPGVEAVIERYAPVWQGWSVPVIVNLAAESVAEFVELARRLEGVPGVAALELNLGCPDPSRGGAPFAVDEDAARAVTSAVRRATDLPLIVKLSAADAIRVVAKAAADAGADALAAINAVPALAVTDERDRVVLGAGYGGLSGPAIHPLALRSVADVAAAVRIPVLAAGGVRELPDVLDFLALGAVGVQVGTAVFADPDLPVRLVDELAAECRRRGLTSYRDLVGRAAPQARSTGRSPRSRA